MKIIKNGKKNCGEFKFKCDKCGCKFEADTSDYIFIEYENFNRKAHHPTENNTPSDTIKCECPNCGKEIVKDIYDDNIYVCKSIIENRKSFGFVVSAIVSLALSVLVLIALLQTMSTKFQVIIGVLTCIYLFIDAIVNLVRYSNEF